TRSAAGNQYVSHQTPLPILAPSERSQRFSTGVPAAAFANQGAATSSTKLSTTSLRQTNELHNGYSTARGPPRISHLAAVAIPPATAPAARITAPDSTSVHHGPSQMSRPCSANSTPSATR